MSNAATYPRLVEKIENWPIYQLSKSRPEFIREINEYTFDKLVSIHGNDLPDLIVKTIYQERQRLKDEPWKVDPPKEAAFWKKVSKQLIKKTLDRSDTDSREAARHILLRIIERYSEEIVGTFQIRTFRFAQSFLTFLLNRLLNAAVAGSIRGLWRGRRQLYERLNVVGDVDTVRSLFQHGTVVITPTHFSNLDSILVGYAMDQIMGLPSFSYGAGLNLYNFGPAAYFMNRLGAYRVDRRKKNTIYLETLKAMSLLSIRRGVNSLFFPGGTRSRSGALETDLKLGLLGTAVEAQRALCQQNTQKKVFIVPMVISYHFVLEAPFLIEQHLRRTGKEQYIRLRDESASIRKWFRFIWRFFSTTSDITLSIGRPMDVMGNFVDAQGRSFDRFGREIQIGEYFMSHNQIIEDRQREGEYTRLLAEKLVERYKEENVVLTSHLMAFIVFHMLVSQNPKLDLYGILRLPTEEYTFPYFAIEDAAEQLQQVLLDREAKGQIKLSPEMRLPVNELIKDGVRKLGVYHREKPLVFTRRGDLVSSNFRVLYYYHNRLTGYELEKTIPWETNELEVLNLD